MRVYRLCRASYPPHDGESARRAGGGWNSQGARVVYMSENRSLDVPNVASAVFPDQFLMMIRLRSGFDMPLFWMSPHAVQSTQQTSD
jgi:RES domain-containing protein